MKSKKRPDRGAPAKSALARVCFIDRQIASGKYPSTKKLAEGWEAISVSTISRDIDFMRNTFNAPIEYDAGRRGYYYSKPQYRIPSSFSGADDLLALGMAKSILSLYRDTPIYAAANHLMNSIIAPLADDSKSDWYESRIVVPQVPSSPVSQDIWSLITAALRENRVLCFDYLRAYDGHFESRRVHPYQLLFDSGVWYLYGYAEERRDVRIFSLCRIQNVELTNSKFSLPKDFEYSRNDTGSYFGVFFGQERRHFKIAFYDHSAVWVKDRQWAEDQKIIETDDGVLITFTSTQFDKVAEWVLSRGSTARPLEPQLLVDFWNNNIEKMRKMAGKK